MVIIGVLITLLTALSKPVLAYGPLATLAMLLLGCFLTALACAKLESTTKR